MREARYAGTKISKMRAKSTAQRVRAGERSARCAGSPAGSAAGEGGVGGRAQAANTMRERDRKGEHPLAHRHARDHAVDQVGVAQAFECRLDEAVALDIVVWRAKLDLHSAIEKSAQLRHRLECCRARPECP